MFSERYGGGQKSIFCLMKGYVGGCDIPVMSVIRKVERKMGTNYFLPLGCCRYVPTL